MNKSKFLKRSLAAILAILMVVAMVPLSALAAETYDISVNSRQATPSDDGTSYAVTIYNTRLASIDWAPKPDRKVQLKTKRNITLDLPVSNLDLMSEATADKDGKVYTLDLIFTDTKTGEKTDAKLNVTVETSVPNDDVTLQAVRVNQTINGKTFSAISGTKPENGKITIKIPLGMKYDQVGFGSGNLTNDIAAQIFVPSSPYAKVTYAQPTAWGAPDANNAQGKVTVTAPTGRTATYDVVFEQEEGLKGMSVNFGPTHSGTASFSERTFENNQTYSVYTAYVPLTGPKAVTTSDAHIIFSHDKNVQRVEDPAKADGDLETWSTSLGQTVDEPIQSGEKGENTLNFKAAGDGSYYTFLSVKTKANNDDTTHAYYGNVKLVLRDKADEVAAKVAPILTELQFNGYESKYNADGLEKTITINVDASYYEQVGAGKLPGRISLKATTNSKVWILNQNGSRAKVTAAGGRIGKPSTISSGEIPANPSTTSYVGNFNTKDRQFTIRVEDPNDANNYSDYVVKLASSGHGTNMSKVKLVSAADGVTTIAEAVKSTGNQFIFYIDKNAYPDATKSVGAVNKDNVPATSPATDAEYNTETYGTTNTLTLKYTFSDGFFTADALEEALDAKAEEAMEDSGKYEAIKYEFRIAWNATDSQLELQVRPEGEMDWEAIAEGTLEVKIGAGFVRTLHANFSVGDVAIGTLNFDFESVGGAGYSYTYEDVWSNSTKTATVTDADSYKTWLTHSPVDNFNTDLAASFFPDTGDAINTTPDGATKVVFTSAVHYAGKTIKTLNSGLTGAYLVIESENGVVLTPGGNLGGRLGATSSVGVSEWGRDNTPYATNGSMDYEEHENYVTTLSNYWNTNYLLKLSADNTVGAPVGSSENDNDAVLVMTTSNKGASNNDRTQTWTIRFEDKADDPVAPTYSEEAELTFQGATTAVDEDLIYDGRTRTAANTVTLASDAPYIGAIAARGDDHNDFTIDAPEQFSDGSGATNEYRVKIHVPEDYFTDGQKVYLYGLTASADSKVYRSNEYQDSTAGVPADNWYKDNLVDRFNLVMDDQTKGGQSSVDAFTVETNVWNGSSFNKNAVGPTNILYVYSEKDANDTNKLNTASHTALKSPTRKYYITFVKDNFDKTETMTGVTAADASTGITGTPNAYEKWLNLSVPFGKNWVNYRDDSSRDFRLNFATGGKAILVDAAQDGEYKPFGSNSSANAATTSYLSLQNQKLREVKIDGDTTFFVKENELWIYDQYTGKETKVTGRGLNTNFTYSGWGVITSGNAELHVFNEDQSSINTYRLTMNVNNASSAKEIVSIRVDETAAVNTSGTLWTVDLGPAGSENLAKVMLNITVSATAEVVSVDGKEYVANGTYDLTKPVTIIVRDENGDTKSFTLSATGEDPNPPVDEKESDKYGDLPANAGMRGWAEKAINYGIMGDTGTAADGKLLFSPSETTQRRWFALMVARADIMAADGTISNKTAADAKLLAEYGNKTPDFKDVANESATAKAAIAYCQEKGIMKGDNGNFNPAGIVNRMEVASMLKNWLKLPEGNKENSNNFKDWNVIDDWAKGNINAVVTDGIMTGQGDTFGKGNLTREQTAVVMVRAFERLKGITD